MSDGLQDWSVWKRTLMKELRTRVYFNFCILEKLAENGKKYVCLFWSTKIDINIRAWSKNSSQLCVCDCACVRACVCVCVSWINGAHLACACVGTASWITPEILPSFGSGTKQLLKSRFIPIAKSFLSFGFTLIEIYIVKGHLGTR